MYVGWVFTIPASNWRGRPENERTCLKRLCLHGYGIDLHMTTPTYLLGWDRPLAPSWHHSISTPCPHSNTTGVDQQCTGPLTVPPIHNKCIVSTWDNHLQRLVIPPTVSTWDNYLQRWVISPYIVCSYTLLIVNCLSADKGIHRCTKHLPTMNQLYCMNPSWMLLSICYPTAWIM